MVPQPQHDSTGSGFFLGIGFLALFALVVFLLNCFCYIVFHNIHRNLLLLEIVGFVVALFVIEISLVFYHLYERAIGFFFGAVVPGLSILFYLWYMVWRLIRVLCS